MGTTLFAFNNRHASAASSRPHGIEIADRQKCQLRPVQLFDELHIGKYVGVSGEIHGAAVRQMEYVAGRLAAIDDLVAVLDTATMDRRGSWWPSRRPDVLGSALIHPAAILDSLGGEPHAGLEDRDHLGLELLRQRNGIVDVVEVAVRNQDGVDAIELVAWPGTWDCRPPTDPSTALHPSPGGIEKWRGRAT